MAIDFEKLADILHIKIKKTELYTIAFTHRSYLNEHPDYKLPSNERIEFLGDAVLQLVSSEYLFTHFPTLPEGKLTNLRAALVCTPSIGAEAKRLGYGQFLLLSNGEETTGGRDREYILANTFEAVLGAIYLEHGFEECKKFIDRELLYKVREIVDNNTYKDAKSKFQELAQEKLGVTPSYKVIESWGLDHEKTFKIGVYIDSTLYGEGEGGSKQKAEQVAAKMGLDKLLSL